MRASAAQAWWPAALVAGVAALALSACGKGEELAGPNGAPMPVAAAFYPLREAAERIGGDRVRVTDLTPIGGQPHDVVLSPAATAALGKSKVVLAFGQGFQPRVDRAIDALPRTVRRADLLAGQALVPAATAIPGVRGEVDGGRDEALEGGEDPHVWVDPARFITIAQQVKEVLIAADPAGKEAYEQRAAAYVGELRKLDADFRSQLAGCAGATVLTSHAAFAYLADDYGLRQAAIAGISPDDTPDARSLAAIGRYARAHDVRTIFFAFPVSAKLQAAVKAATGAATDALNPVEGLTFDQLDAKAGYVSIQRDNLGRLVRGLPCTAA
ncbi:MAG: zinc ABC transporter substrate-binding protein [Patulibacter minatonensis]